MSGGPRAVLDACVLIPMPLADTLLRLAEHPSLYEPKWSQEILAEVTRNLIHKWGMSPEKAARREAELRRHFPEASVQGHQHLIESMRNDPDDRHVLAAAFHSHSKVIVTYNVRHFPLSALEPLHIHAQAPSNFLLSLYDRAPSLVREKLHQQAENLNLPIERLFGTLAKNVPAFVARLRNENIG